MLDKMRLKLFRLKLQTRERVTTDIYYSIILEN